MGDLGTQDLASGIVSPVTYAVAMPVPEIEDLVSRVRRQSHYIRPVQQDIVLASGHRSRYSIRSDFIRSGARATPPRNNPPSSASSNHADRLIRRYIRAKQKLIKLLKEQKQAIIHHAITRGLDPNVRLKPSGVEWLGDVPEHWEVKRFKCGNAAAARSTDLCLQICYSGVPGLFPVVSSGGKAELNYSLDRSKMPRYRCLGQCWPLRFSPMHVILH